MKKYPITWENINFYTPITYDAVKFNVNSKKHTVVAYIEGIEKLAENYIRDNCTPLDCTILNSMTLMPNHFCAKAVCSPEDTWDEDLGKRIAYNRLKNKIYSCMFKRLQYYVDSVQKRLDDFISICNNYGNKLATDSERRLANINKRLSGN